MESAFAATARMMPSVARPPALTSSLVVERKISSFVGSMRSDQSSSTRIDFDDVDNDNYFTRKTIKCWNRFYRRHQNKFFKDRHYLEKDWGKYFSRSDDATASANDKVLLEVGCGAGNTIFPLVAAYPNLYVHACDFSVEALSLVKSNSSFNVSQINLFVCDVANEELCDKIAQSSVDVVTLIFMLSAVSPCKMAFVLQNLKKVLKPNGHILVRDYALGDSAQVKLEKKNQIISDNYYFRGDGTLSFFFSEDYLWRLFVNAGFHIVDINTYCRQVANRSRNMRFERRWIRGIFRKMGMRCGS